MKRWQVITIVAVTGFASCGFYLFYWRKRKGISSADADKIGQVKVVLDETANKTGETPIYEVE